MKLSRFNGVHTRALSRAVTMSALLLLLGGCYTVAVDYHPTSAMVGDSAQRVRVVVEDAREEGRGLGDDRVIGQYRGSFGIPKRVYNGEAGVMPSSVRAATEDSLAAAGVAVDDGAERTLVARVTQFWADGMMGIGAWVTVEYELEGEWSLEIEATSGAGGAGNPLRVVETAIERTLVDLAEKASAAFSDDPFQAAIRQ